MALNSDMMPEVPANALYITPDLLSFWGADQFIGEDGYPHIGIHPDIEDWCNESLMEGYELIFDEFTVDCDFDEYGYYPTEILMERYLILFKNQTDLILFKMRWL